MSYGRLMGSIDISGQPVHAPDRRTDDVHLAFEFARLLGPCLGEQMMTNLYSLLVELARQRDTLLESALRACESSAQVFVERKAHNFGRIGVTDVATKT